MPFSVDVVSVGLASLVYVIGSFDCVCNHAASGAEVAAVPFIRWCGYCHTHCGLATCVVSPAMQCEKCTLFCEKSG